jgi:hypothetical protein
MVKNIQVAKTSGFRIGKNEGYVQFGIFLAMRLVQKLYYVRVYLKFQVYYLSCYREKIQIGQTC